MLVERVPSAGNTIRRRIRRARDVTYIASRGEPTLAMTGSNSAAAFIGLFVLITGLVLVTIARRFRGTQTPARR